MAVRIYLEIGHEASLRTKKTQEGFTHDWEVFVRGCDGAEIHYYVEKVVFYLHDTFPKPKRVIKEPPYLVKESGYAGFNLPIDIYLRSSSEPKKIRFNYDLHLQQSGPPILKVQKEKYVFNNPTDDFKMKVLKGGGSIGGSSSSSSSSQEVVNDSRSNLEDKNQLINKPKLSGCDIIKKPKIKPGEPCHDFQELFGSPITMSSKTSFEQKSQSTKIENKPPRTKHSPHKDSHKDKEKSKEKNEASDKKNKDEKKQKEKAKDRERSKDKNVKKDKSPRPKSPSPSPKKTSPPRFSSPPMVKHKESKHDRGDRKEKSEKVKKDKKKEHKSDEQKSGEDHRKSETKKSELVKPKADDTKKEKLKEKLPKEDKSHSEKYKHKKKDKEKRDKKEEKSYKAEKRQQESTKSTNLFKAEPPPPSQSELLSPTKKAKPAPPSFIPNVDDDSSNSSSSSSGSSLIDKKLKNDAIKLKEDKNPKLRKEKSYQESAIKCKRKLNSVDKHEEPPEKMPNSSALNSDSEEQEKESKPAISTPKEVEEDYFGLLRDLQHKIMGLKDNEDLQKIVQLIAETGRFEVSAHTFDFDLCLLDRSTVQQLQNFFASET